MRFLIPCILLLAQVSLAQTPVDLPNDLASSGNDGVGGIEAKPPGNVPLGKLPGLPNNPGGAELGDVTAPPPSLNDLHAEFAGTTHDLGGGLPGEAGTPRAETVDDAHGELASLRLSDTGPQVPVVLVLGLSTLEMPFKGGTMIPTPDLLIGLGNADDEGRLDVPAYWPADVPPCIPLVLQYWMSDPTGPEGMTASNALLLISP